MFKEIGRVTELLKYPQNKILDLDKVAHVNGEGLTLTVATEECAELIQAITKLKRYGFYDKYNELLEAFNRNNSEPVEEIMTLDDWLKKEKEEEKNAEE